MPYLEPNSRNLQQDKLELNLFNNPYLSFNVRKVLITLNKQDLSNKNNFTYFYLVDKLITHN